MEVSSIDYGIATKNTMIVKQIFNRLLGVSTPAQQAANYPLLEVNLYFTLLPFVEQGNLFNEGLTGDNPPAGVGNYRCSDGVTTYHNKPIKLFQCPSDSSIPNSGLVDTYAASSYVFNFALFTTPRTTASWYPAKFTPQYTLGNMPDGTSNTVAFAERLGTCGSGSPIYYSFLFYTGTSGFTGSGPSSSYAGFNIATMVGQAVGASPSVYPALPQIGVAQSTCTNGLEPSTSHTGAMVVGISDGSARIIGPGVGNPTWYYACNPGDGVPLGSDW